MDVEISLTPRAPADAESLSGNTPQHLLAYPQGQGPHCYSWKLAGPPCGLAWDSPGEPWSGHRLPEAPYPQLSSSGPPDGPWQGPDDRRCQPCNQVCCGDEETVGMMHKHVDVQVFTQQTSTQALQCGQPGPGPGCPAVNTMQPLEPPGKAVLREMGPQHPLPSSPQTNTKMRQRPGSQWRVKGGRGHPEQTLTTSPDTGARCPGLTSQSLSFVTCGKGW